MSRRNACTSSGPSSPDAALSPIHARASGCAARSRGPARNPARPPGAARPVTAEALGAPLENARATPCCRLLQLEAEGAVMRGAFTAPARGVVRPPPAGAHPPRHPRQAARRSSSRCRRRSSCASCSAGISWHQRGRRAPPGRRRAGRCAAPARRHAAPAGGLGRRPAAARVEPTTCLPCSTSSAPSGRVAWWRPTEPATRPAARRDRCAARRCCCASATPSPTGSRRPARRWSTRNGALRLRAARCSNCCAHGASFFADLQHDARLLGTQVEQALAELVAHGLVTCDSFAGLRTLVMPADKRNKLRRKGRGARPDRRRGPLVADAAAAAAWRRAGRAGRSARRAHRPRAAAPLRRGVPQAARTRGRAAAVARAVLRAAPAGGARRSARRPLRQRLLGRAVRAARGRGGPAQDRRRRLAASVSPSPPSIP
jgi:hypothetical protein